MVKRLTASALVLSLVSFASAQAASSCFTPEEAKAAHFRTMLQEFNVAALNCRSIDPNDPSVGDRYNIFVAKFGAKLQENASAMRVHFKRSGGNLDQWMTRVANDAGQRVMTDPDFCQKASDILDKAITVEGPELDGFATTTMVADRYVDECSTKPAATPAKGKGKGKKKSKPKTTKTANAE